MCRMKFIITSAAIGLLLVSSAFTRAQEPELVNEIVARVNSDIITRADYLNALKDLRDQLTREMTGKSEDQINAEYERIDRKSTRLNSSHLGISYAVFCLKK